MLHDARPFAMAHAVASMSAVSAAVAGPRFTAQTAKGSSLRVSTLAQRTAARKVASQMASSNVNAIIVEEETAEAGTGNAALYAQFSKLLVDYEFAYKVGDKISGKCFHCDAKGAWVDIGAKAAALCPASEASLADVKNVSGGASPAKNLRLSFPDYLPIRECPKASG